MQKIVDFYAPRYDNYSTSEYCLLFVALTQLQSLVTNTASRDSFFEASFMYAVSTLLITVSTFH